MLTRPDMLPPRRVLPTLVKPKSPKLLVLPTRPRRRRVFPELGLLMVVRVLTECVRPEFKLLVLVRLWWRVIPVASHRGYGGEW